MRASVFSHDVKKRRRVRAIKTVKLTVDVAVVAARVHVPRRHTNVFRRTSVHQSVVTYHAA